MRDVNHRVFILFLRIVIYRNAGSKEFGLKEIKGNKLIV